MIVRQKNGLIAGCVKPGFEAVREAFIENFARRNELGAACCIYYRGEKVADLWGGLRNIATGELWEEDTYARNLEDPSGNGVGTARAIARAYHVFSKIQCSEGTGGQEPGLDQKTLQALMAPAVPPLHGFYDEVMKKEMSLSLGFLKPCGAYPFGNPGAYGEPGAGGSFAYADPEAEIAYAYVANQMGAKLGGDPRDLALREALHRSIVQTI
jgi:hypothetical protein